MKKCSMCGVEKEDSEFRIRTDNRHGQFSYLNNTCKPCDSAASNKYYFRRKGDPEFMAQWRKRSRDNYKKNADERKKAMKVKRNQQEYKENRKQYEAKNRKQITDVHRASAKKWSTYQIKNITDVYCIGLIRGQNGGMNKCGLITQEMIQQKRLQIQIKRKLYEIRQKTSTRRNNGRVNSVFSGININGGIPSKYA